MYRNVQTSEKISISSRSVSLSSEFRNRGTNYLILSFQLKQYSQLVPYQHQHRWCSISFIIDCCRSAPLFVCFYIAWAASPVDVYVPAQSLLHITQMWPWIWLVSQLTCYWGLGTMGRRVSTFFLVAIMRRKNSNERNCVRCAPLVCVKRIRKALAHMSYQR